MQNPKKVLTISIQNLALISVSFFLLNLNFNNLARAPLVYPIITLIAGLLAGLFIQHRSVKKQLQSIEREGYYKPKTTNIALRLGIQLLFILLLGLIMVVALSIYVIVKAPFWLFTINSVVGIALAATVTETVYYWRWQHKNNRILLLDKNILYPYPYMNQPTSKETIY